MKKRLIYNSDKSVQVICAIRKSKSPNETEGQWLSRIFDKSTPIGAIYEDIEESLLPTESIEAWIGEKGKPIIIDLSLIQQKLDVRKAEARQKKLEQIGLTEDDIKRIKAHKSIIQKIKDKLGMNGGVNET